MSAKRRSIWVVVLAGGDGQRLRALTTSFTDKLTHLYNAQGFVRASEHMLAVLNGPASCAMLLAIEVGNVKAIERAPANPSKCTELIAALNENIDAANSADPNMHRSLGGKYCLFDPRRSYSIESWIESQHRSK